MRLNANTKAELASCVASDRRVGTGADYGVEAVAYGIRRMESDPLKVKDAKTLQPGTN
jgi:hypothetical protein